MNFVKILLTLNKTVTKKERYYIFFANYSCHFKCMKQEKKGNVIEENEKWMNEKKRNR